MFDQWQNAMHGKTYEPEKRKCAGVYGYVSHRFPIKGGISSLDVLAMSVKQNNSMLEKLKRKS